MSICATCGQENPPGARFCNGCGLALDAAPSRSREERRIVSVLFADMAGFTARAERLDPEDVRAILDRYYARLRTEIDAFGGAVEKFIGDAVVAIFGAPVAHGDDPERAVRAALAICRAVADMNAADPELNLEIRVAVNTGEAIVSVAQSELREGMVAGDVINTASRLQSAAPSNGILVGEGTYRATRGLVEYREIEPLMLKGKSEPVRAWIALGTSAGPGERAATGVPMLGRAGELAALHRIFDGVVTERRPHLVTLFGEAGIGKSRLTAEFADQLPEPATRILRGRALPYGASTPYGPFAQHVKVFAGIFASDDLATAQAKLRSGLEGLTALTSVDEIAAHLELLTGLEAAGEVADRQVLFLAARRFAEALAQERPTVLIFEDIHWADSGTLDVIELLASRVRDVPLLLVALARPDLLLTRPSWGGGLPAYTSLSLGPLDAQDAAELARRLLTRHAAGPHRLGVVETAEGNPLFIEELAATAYERPLSAGQELPTTIRELVSARLDALPGSEREILLDAAIVGKTFWWGALVRMHEAGLTLTEALDSLEARDLIRHEPVSWIEGEEQFTFKHALIRDVAYATVPRSRRAELHGLVARFLEEATAGAGATATALAHHWREAGENQRALDHLVAAAEAAGRGWAKDEAAALYGQAAELCEDQEGRRELKRRQALSLVAAQHVADMRSQRPSAQAIDAQ
ncbi:MAG TPA: AAA family ATPase [Solirubrobacteraceae bacterium]|nr:AAA family ATPase [Solirubrobacteraceae bacterium]